MYLNLICLYKAYSCCKLPAYSTDHTGSKLIKYFNSNSLKLMHIVLIELWVQVFLGLSSRAFDLRAAQVSSMRVDVDVSVCDVSSVSRSSLEHKTRCDVFLSICLSRLHKITGLILKSRLNFITR